ncbi:rhamnosyltransferase [Microbacterium foliorum]|uniref:glycosyltransferase n=1 Tax=Microbacterium foliorum TaxID=104336 RepID=UPI00209E50C0|nr:glycosyltransferase [Microbacterium foliorum]MCP1429495.1 rhamnosyltransferase [Microbacterium foliorum]
MASPSDVAVVFTTFHPAEPFVDVVRSLCADFPVIVVDDGTDGISSTLDAVESLGALVIRQPENLGIAAALNVGLHAAFSRGSQYAITFDQDSTPRRDTVEVLRTAFSAPHDARRVAAVVPGHFADVKQSSGAGAYPDARRVIQSGMMLSARSFEELGDFDERLFIDLVDTEYELRIIALGRHIIAAPTRIGHELGRTLGLRPFGALPPTVTTMASTPFRYYYRARNRVLITGRYFTALPARTVRDLFVDLAYFALILASARPRRAMAHVLARGFRDGFRGRGGRMPEETADRARTVSWSTS